MQLPLSSFSPKPYAAPVSFNCTVNNNALTAEIIEEVYNPIDYTFKIKYSDGVLVEATSSESGKWWVNNFKNRDYIKAIENELHDFVQVKNNEWEKFEIKQQGNILLVWISKSLNEEKQLIYSVYHSGSYRFDLRKVKNKWEAKCIKVKDPGVDENLAALVSARIDAIE